MSSTKTSRIGSIVAFVISGIFIVTSLWLLLNKQWATDQLSVWSYEPTETIQTMSDTVEFTDRGRFIFYATKPDIVSQQAFNQECPRQEPGSPILGCYTGSDRIYVYDITNDKLRGMEEVTAVHEMLHAVWYRMSDQEREDIGKKLQAAYEGLDDESIISRMEYYKRTEPAELLNELHSILGTEVTGLGDSLEAYYSQYFDREVVLGLHEQYNSVYERLYERSDELYQRMEKLGEDITRRTEDYNQAAEQYSADVDSFNARADSGDFSSVDAFYAERAQLVARSNALESERKAINSRIATYDKYYREYQSIAKQIEVLNKSVDSFNELDAAPSV